MEKNVPLALSVVIIAKNEQGRIKDCLESVYGWADDIVVLDDESTDDTRAIAAGFTDKIFIRHMELEGKHRNFGASKTKNDWIMLLDCDERLTDDLKNEIAVRSERRRRQNRGVLGAADQLFGRCAIKPWRLVRPAYPFI